MAVKTVLAAGACIALLAPGLMDMQAIDAIYLTVVGVILLALTMAEHHA